MSAFVFDELYRKASIQFQIISLFMHPREILLQHFLNTTLIVRARESVRHRVPHLRENIRQTPVALSRRHPLTNSIVNIVSKLHWNGRGDCILDVDDLHTQHLPAPPCVLAHPFQPRQKPALRDKIVVYAVLGKSGDDAAK